MPFVADLHVHSPYSRATSQEMDLEGLYRWSQYKGITVVGTGDFTHPRWFETLREQLEPAEPGLYRLREDLARKVDASIPEACRRPVRFLVTGEISSIYTREGRTRKVHNLLLMPDLQAASRLNRRLARVGNLESDGRPILGLDSEHLLQMVLEEVPDALLIPAHAWTPHFSVFGANSGFDSLEACFGELTPHIRAIETGLSSDPPMNWRLSQLEGITLVSNSDAHSPSRLGREGNLFDTELSYPAIRAAIVEGDPRRFLGTLEFFPEEGKYHLDGHRACRVRLHPQETRSHGYRCPRCGREVTVGVMHRVESLADRPEGYRPPRALPFWNLIPLSEILGEIQGKGAQSRSVTEAYFQLLAQLGGEMEILLYCPLEAIAQAGGVRLAEAIGRMRRGEVQVQAGYDGEYGVIRVFSQDGQEKVPGLSQLSLF